LVHGWWKARRPTTSTITTDTRYGRETKTAETPAEALAWVEEFRDRGAKEFYIWDCQKKRWYTERELEEMANAQGT